MRTVSAHTTSGARTPHDILAAKISRVVSSLRHRTPSIAGQPVANELQGNASAAL
jgi:hypothetical protein